MLIHSFTLVLIGTANVLKKPFRANEEDMPYHRNSIFAEPKHHCRPITREQRAQVLFLAEKLERRTKDVGRKNGALGYVGLEVLRALLKTFANRKTGACFPSYVALQAATGLCRTSISNALKRLEIAGLLKICRRIVRRQITRANPYTGLTESYVGVVQCSNLYAFSDIDVDRAYELHEKRSQVHEPHCNQPLLSLIRKVKDGFRLKPPQRRQNLELFA